MNEHIEGLYEPKKTDTDFYGLIPNEICVGNFTLTQNCVRMALEVAL